MRGRELLQKVVKVGLIGGAVLVFLAAVGLIEKFGVRELIGAEITLGRVMLALPAFAAAYLVLRPRMRAGEWEHTPAREALAAGAETGAIVGGVMILFVSFVKLIGEEAVRNIFISISPTLLSTVTFDQGLAAAAIILVVGGAGLGAAAAGFRLLPQPYRRPVFVGLAVLLLVALLQRIVPTILFELGAPTGWLYLPAAGLTYGGAIIVLAVGMGASWLWAARRSAVRQWLGERSSSQARSGILAIGGLGLLAVLVGLPFLIGSILSNILGQVGLFLLMALGLNIVVGYAGLLDLGYVAFFAVGAYSIALLTGANLVTSLGETAAPAASLNLSFWAALPIVIVIAMFVGVLIGAPVLRLRGDYLAIVTLGFGEIARVLSESQVLRNFIGGAQGVRDVTDAAIAGYEFRTPEHFYYLALGLVILAVYVSWRLANSRVGRAWNAMREDEQVAEAMGISTTRYKLLAFAMGGAVGSLGGAIFAVQLNTVQPGSFIILVSITVLAVVILGGMGSIPGVIVGGLVLIGLPGLLSEFEEFRPLIYGAVIIAIMILRPQGLIPNVRRARELTEEERTQDQWLRQQEADAGGTTATMATGGAEGEHK